MAVQPSASWRVRPEGTLVHLRFTYGAGVRPRPLLCFKGRGFITSLERGSCCAEPHMRCYLYLCEFRSSKVSQTLSCSIALTAEAHVAAGYSRLTFEFHLAPKQKLLEQTDQFVSEKQTNRKQKSREHLSFMHSLPAASNNLFLSFVYAYLCFEYVCMVYVCVHGHVYSYMGVRIMVGVFLK